MARLVTSGGELRDHITVDIGSPDGYSAGAAATATETTVVRTGVSTKCAGTAANTSFRAFPLGTVALGTSIFFRAYVNFSALPSATKKVAAIVGGAGGVTALVSARLTSAGLLQLWNDVAGTQIGSDSVDVLAVDSWYRVELKLTIGTGAVDDAELRLALPSDQWDAVGATIAATSAVSISDAVPTQARVGWIDAPGVTSNLFFDDCAVNDSTGTNQSTWPGGGQISLVLGLVADAKTGWPDCRNSEAYDVAPELLDALGRMPPTAHADSTSDTTGHQVRTAVTSAGQHLQVMLDSYSRYGLIGNVICDEGGASDELVGPSATLARVAWSFFMVGTVDYAEVLLKRLGSPTDDLIVELLTDTGSNNPSGTVLATATLAAAGITTAAFGAWYRLPAWDVPLTTGQRYWLAFRRSGSYDNANVIAVQRLDTRVGNHQVASYVDPTGWSGAGAYSKPGMRLYNTQGYATVKVLQSCVLHGEAIATGTKTGTVQLTARPAEPSVTTFDFGNNVGAAGTYPTNWRWKRGNVTYDYNPKSSAYSPTIVVEKTDGTTRVALTAFLGAMLEFTPPPF